MFIGIVLFFCLAVMFFVITKSNRARGVTVFSSITVAYSVYYFAVPLIISWLCLQSSEDKSYFNEFLRKGGFEGISFYLLLVCTYFACFVLCYNQFKIRSRKYYFKEFVFFRLLKVVGAFSLCVGGVSFILYVHYLGGIINALALAEFARSYSGDMSQFLTGTQTLLIVPSRTLVLAPFCMLLLWDYTKEKKYRFLLVVALVLVFLFLLFNASRTILVVYIVAFGFPLLKSRFKHPWLILMLIAVLGLNLLNILDALFVYFANDSIEIKTFEIDEIIKQFSFPYRNVLHSYDIISKNGCFWGSDFITVFLDYVPGFHFSATSDVTSYYFSGDDWKKSGGIPNDLVTYSLLEFHYLGVVLIPFIISRIIVRVENSLAALEYRLNSRYSVLVFSTYLLLSVFFCVSSADFASIVGNFSIFVFFFILCLSQKNK